jgi:N-acetylneuraminate synthase
MLNNKIYVNGTAIGKGERPYIIAEVGSNFDQSLDKAKKLIDVAVAAGASRGGRRPACAPRRPGMP